MKNFKSYFLFLLFLPCLLSARPVETFYGPIEVEEPVLLELIDSPAFQRLKRIHQYGVAYYVSHKEEFNRYDHSVGVFAVLKENNAPLKEQIAGLLHDVSHTAFSHVGDWVFGRENEEDDYQDLIHTRFLKESGLAAILEKYNYTAEEMAPEEEFFPALESRLPDLCADRIDYNIQGAYYQGFITKEEALKLFKSIRFTKGQWVCKAPELVKKLTRFSIFMTEDCWGSPKNHITSRWLADAILRAVELKKLSQADFHHGTDQEIWDKLSLEKDPIIQKNMNMLKDPHKYFSIVKTSSEASLTVKSKFRGINPWIVTPLKLQRITALDDTLAKEYEEAQKRVAKGWLVKLN